MDKPQHSFLSDLHYLEAFGEKIKVKQSHWVGMVGPVGFEPTTL
jgi:hypothetical protein